MKTVEFTLPAESWRGIITKYPIDSGFIGADDFIDGSYNFITNEKGIINKRPGGINYNTSLLSDPVKDQYEAVFTTGVRHMLVMSNGTLHYSNGGGSFSSVTSGYSAVGNMEFASYRDRVYFGNGINNPQAYDLATNYGGNTFTAPKTKDMGCQPPSTVATGSAVAGSGVPDGSYRYKVTYLYYDFEESNGNAASSIITTSSPNNQVNLTIPTVTTLYGVTARKIYRAPAPNYDVYTLVGTVSNNTSTTFSDNTTLGTLPIPYDNELPPQFSLIVNHLDRLWVAGVQDSQSTIYWSEAGLPDIFSSFNFILCNPKDPIIGLYVYNDRVIVFNRNSMGQILGRTSADFRYSEISPSVGCVDNRSIQIRTIQGVPTLIWLSSIGPYEFNGSSINQIGENIENLFKLNIQQANQVKGKYAESTFTSGTPSNGIERAGGTLTTPNPIKEWVDRPEWEEVGALYTNVNTKETNDLKAPTKADFDFNTGIHNNTIVVSNDLTLTTSVDWTGETKPTYSTMTGLKSTAGNVAGIYQSTLIPRGGTITSFTIKVQHDDGTWLRGVIRNNNGGEPGSIIWQSSLINRSTLTTYYDGNSSPYYILTFTLSQNIPSSAVYWFGVEARNSTDTIYQGHLIAAFPAIGTYNGSINSWGYHEPAGWRRLLTNTNLDYPDIQFTYTFVSSPVAASGIWNSPVWDSGAEEAIPDSIYQAANFPTYTSSITTVETCSNGDFNNPTNYDSQDFNNLNGTNSITTITGKRYWRIKLTLSTTDDRNNALITNPPVLKFAQVVYWISAPINHNAPEFALLAGHDVYSLDELNVVKIEPSGTAVVAQIATSADNITYSAWSAIGSATPNKWSKIRLQLTTDTNNALTPTVERIELKWTLKSTFTSVVIDTATTPAGWELFQSDGQANGGTLAYEFKAASTVPGLVGATWYAVTAGQFIPVTPYRYAQWRTTITSTTNNLPTIGSITVNWFIQTTTSIRVASLFYDKQYYLAAAEYDNATNNVVFMYDQDNNWKFFRGLTINTFCTFFTDAYYGSSLNGQIVKWLSNDTDQGTSIAFDIRTKAFSRELESEEKTKYLRQLVIRGLGTGARLTPSISVDGGTTYLPLTNVETGLQYLDTIADGKIFIARFSITTSTNIHGKTLIIRIYNNDNYPVQLHTLRAKCWISDREVLNG